ncbi:hypothetical protein K8U54_19020 [Pseudomonas fulva]|uniref:hypothetical protein n=1 Tax=Pseudomonas fulva TaxID=47880 RepID=UPI00201DFA11|nr:hypothetical protein [Pseudomonas fulva]UQY33783.1 hypothetical protein K8U54_19020 [Pseudomonas fulva]
MGKNLLGSADIGSSRIGAAMEIHDVFGIRPELSDHSYVDRGELDEIFGRLIRRKQQHIAIRGASKSGKSWLRQKVLNNPIIVQCRWGYDVNNIYTDALARLDIELTVEKTTGRGFSGSVKATGEAGFKLIAKVCGELEVEGEFSQEIVRQSVGKDIKDLEFVATLIRESGRTLVIEDFHYMGVEEQRKFAFDLKTLWDYRTLVVVVGVWTSENMLISLNTDLADRIQEIKISWSKNDLKSVLAKGCGNLNFRLKDSNAEKLAVNSYESVGLLQSLALRFLEDELKLDSAAPRGEELLIDDLAAIDAAAMHVADQLNEVYQTFAKRVCEGIRTRQNATGIYAHAMAAVMESSEDELNSGVSARKIHEVAHARESRIVLGNLKRALVKFPELQVDEDGRGLVLAYDSRNEMVSVVDKRLLLYRKYLTVKWPWEDLIAEVSSKAQAFEE